MKPWIERPFEIRNLFNPAFCAVLLLRSFEGFENEDDSGMPFSLSVLVLPMCLHKGTRELITANPRKNFLKLISDNPQMLVGFGDRTRSLLPYSLEALGLAMQHGSFATTLEGHLKLQPRGIRKKIDGTEESIRCQKAAKIVGRNCARIGDKVTLYTTLGIRP